MRQADVEFTVRTDLALEEREKVQGSEIPGIRVREWEKEETSGDRGAGAGPGERE